MRNIMITLLIIFIFVSIVSMLYIIMVYNIYISKGSLHMYENSPVSYINKPMDLNSSDLVQKYEFKNTVIGKHGIELKILSESLPSHIFNGEYRVTIYDSKNQLVKDYLCATNLNKEWYRVNLTTDWSDESYTNYYKFGEVELNKIDSYTLTVKNIKGLSSTGKGKYQIGIYPFEYNYITQKRKYDIETFKKTVPYLVTLIVCIFCLIGIHLRRPRL